MFKELLVLLVVSILSHYPHSRCHTFMCKHKHEQPRMERERERLVSVTSLRSSSLDFVFYY